jgi:hypothetical protein
METHIPMGYIRVTMIITSHTKDHGCDKKVAQKEVKSEGLKQMHFNECVTKMENIGIFEVKNYCSVAVLTSEQLPWNGQVLLKHVVQHNFNLNTLRSN